MAHKHVGRPLKRLEDPRPIQGLDSCVADVPLPNARSMTVVRSPYAHAEIPTIDTKAAIANAVVDARASRGVTHIDLPLTPARIWAAISRS